MLYTKLNNAIFHINKKIESHGITLGDSLILLSFEIAKIELLNDNTLSDNTLSALFEISSRTSRFYYCHDYPDLFMIIENTLDMKIIHQHNPNAFSLDIDPVGIEMHDWSDFFAKGVEELFKKLKQSAI